MNQLKIYIPIYIGKLYKFIKNKFKRKRYLTLQVPLELNDYRDYQRCVVKTIEIMEHNINIKNK